MDKISVTVENGVKELVIRQGEALPIEPETRRVVIGSIKSCAEFFNKRKSIINLGTALIEYSYKQRHIILRTEDNYKGKGYDIDGRLDINPRLEELGIFTGDNKIKLYDIKNLSQTIRFNKSLFKEAAECNTLIENISKLRLEVNRTIESEENNRGNKKELNEITVNTKIPLGFTLKSPLFLGEADKTFSVAICFEVRDRGISLWLESEELAQLIQLETKRIIDNEIKQLSELVCIEY